MDGMELIRHLGRSGFRGGVCIFSNLDKKIISLASEIAKQNQIHLISSIKKPISEQNVMIALAKFHSLLERTEEFVQDISIDELKNAIHSEELIPYYQPKIDLESKKVIGIELLARINRTGSNNAIQAGQFIDIAERCGLMNLLTHTLFSKALNEYKEIRNEISQDLKLCFNLSPKQLGDLEAMSQIKKLFKTFDIPAEQLTIEVTEERSLKSANQLETLNRFKMKGYGVAIDDFGAGFTNLPQLIKLPITEVKIDRSLISNIHIDVFSQIIVNSLIELTKELKIELTAEGIETINELKYLSSLNANLTLQGYIISKPKPKTEFIRWFKAWKHQNNL